MPFPLPPFPLLSFPLPPPPLLLLLLQLPLLPFPLPTPPLLLPTPLLLWPLVLVVLPPLSSLVHAHSCLRSRSIALVHVPVRVLVYPGPRYLLIWPSFMLVRARTCSFVLVCVLMGLSVSSPAFPVSNT
jgi:hypothetical protein